MKTLFSHLALGILFLASSSIQAKGSPKTGVIRWSNSELPFLQATFDRVQKLKGSQNLRELVLKPGEETKVQFSKFLKENAPIAALILPFSSLEARHFFDAINEMKMPLPVFILPFASEASVTKSKLPARTFLLNLSIGETIRQSQELLKSKFQCDSLSAQINLPQAFSQLQEDLMEELQLSSKNSFKTSSCGSVYKMTRLSDKPEHECRFIISDNARLPDCVSLPEASNMKQFIIHSEPMDYVAPGGKAFASAKRAQLFLLSSSYIPPNIEFVTQYESKYKQEAFTKLQMLSLEALELANSFKVRVKLSWPLLFKTEFGTKIWSARSIYPKRPVSFFQLKESGEATHLVTWEPSL